MQQCYDWRVFSAAQKIEIYGLRVPWMCALPACVDVTLIYGRILKTPPLGTDQGEGAGCRRAAKTSLNDVITSRCPRLPLHNRPAPARLSHISDRRFDRGGKHGRDPSARYMRSVTRPDGV